MRVLIAPDEYGGNLSAQQVAQSIAQGWQLAAPEDELTLIPMSDGGPGFLTCITSVLTGELVSLTVRGPLGEAVPAAILHVGDTAYIESASAIGLSLVPDAARNPLHTTSYGLGELLLAAARLPVSRIVIGLGGSGTNDAGAGLLSALGLGCAAGGGGHLGETTPEQLTNLGELIDRFAEIDLVAATDVDVPLLGFTGASAGFAEQKGANPQQSQLLEQNLAHFSRLLCAAAGQHPRHQSLRHRNLLENADRGNLENEIFKHLTRLPGAGAAGGVGFALAVLGATLVSGARAVAEVVGLDKMIRQSDLVVTGEGSLDWQSLHGKVVGSIAELCAADLVPCVVVVGQSHVSRREWATAGISGVYSLAEHPGQVRQSMANPHEHLRLKSQQVAQTWSR